MPDVEIDLEAGDKKAAPPETKDDLELEIVDDTPEEDRGRPRRPEGAEPEIPTDEEIANYSKGVKERISKLKYEFHEERRTKEAAQRERDEAIALAKKTREEAERLRKIVEDGEKVLLNESKGRLSSEIERTKREYKEAYEGGDADKLAEASAKLAELQSHLTRVNSYSPQKMTPIPEIKEPEAPKDTRSQRDKDWMAKNSWFGTDKRMTGFAMGIHEELVTKGVAPGSEEYYRQIDEDMRKTFPTLGDSAPPRTQVGTVVAPTDRTVVANPRKVRLTETQVNLARKLGLTPEQYARELLKQQGRA